MCSYGFLNNASCVKLFYLIGKTYRGGPSNLMTSSNTEARMWRGRQGECNILIRNGVNIKEVSFNAEDTFIHGVFTRLK